MRAMPSVIPDDSVGIVQPQCAIFGDEIQLEGGGILPGFELCYETYGELDATHGNAVLVCHSLSGNHHAAGYHSMDDDKPGWWDICIGPGKPIDTDKLFVVSSNNLGGCHGSTGPLTIDPRTDRPYGPDFPLVTVGDWVRTQAMLADLLAIDRWAAVIGGSLGGMQALQWSMDYPERVAHAVVIAAASKLSAQNIAFNEIARHAIRSDPDFHEGRYRSEGTLPVNGLAQARMVGHVTYQSDDGLRRRFDRKLQSGDWNQGMEVEFQVESYLQHKGRTFSRQFDANTYLLMTRVLDHFDPARAHDDDLTAALQQSKCAFLVISFTTDWRFSPARSQEIIDALVRAKRPVSGLVIDMPEGHDGFLLDNPRYLQALRNYFRSRVIRGAGRREDAG